MIPLGMTLDAQQVFTDQMHAPHDRREHVRQRLGRPERHVPLARHDDRRGPARQRSTARSAQRRSRSRSPRASCDRCAATGPLTQPLPAGEQPTRTTRSGDGDPTASPIPTRRRIAGRAGRPAATRSSRAVRKPARRAEPPRVRQTLPDFQLFDRTTQKWVEFPHPDVEQQLSDRRRRSATSTRAARVLFRFVNRRAGPVRRGADVLPAPVDRAHRGSIGSDDDVARAQPSG